MNTDFEYIPNPDYDPEKPLVSGNFPDMIDPLCAASKWWCQNYQLKLIALNFMDESTKKAEYISGFKATLTDLKNYMERHSGCELSQRYYDELASFQSAVKEYFPINQNYQKLLKKYLYPEDEIIDFSKLENLFSELKFDYQIKSLKKQKQLKKALWLIAYHQIAPPQWLSKLMLEKFKVNDSEKLRGFNEEKLDEIFSAVENKPPSDSLEYIAEKFDIDDRLLDEIIHIGKLRKQKNLLGLSYLP